MLDRTLGRAHRAAARAGRRSRSWCSLTGTSSSRSCSTWPQRPRRHARRRRASTIAIGRRRRRGHGADVVLRVHRHRARAWRPTSLARAFEPFFTTKPHGRGHRPRARHGLRHRRSRAAASVIDRLARSGSGTTITVVLPASGESGQRHRAAGGPSGGGGTSGSCWSRTRRRCGSARPGCSCDHGYDVLVGVRRGRGARGVRRRATPIDLVVTDVAMPRMRGDELARRLVERRPRPPGHLHVRLRLGRRAARPAGSSPSRWPRTCCCGRSGRCSMADPSNTRRSAWSSSTTTGCSPRAWPGCSPTRTASTVLGVGPTRRRGDRARADRLQPRRRAHRLPACRTATGSTSRPRSSSATRDVMVGDAHRLDRRPGPPRRHRGGLLRVPHQGPGRGRGRRRGPGRGRGRGADLPGAARPPAAQAQPHAPSGRRRPHRAGAGAAAPPGQGARRTRRSPPSCTSASTRCATTCSRCSSSSAPTPSSRRSRRRSARRSSTTRSGPPSDHATWGCRPLVRRGSGIYPHLGRGR